MLKLSLTICATVFCLFSHRASSAERFVTISIENRTPSIEVDPSIEIFGAAPDSFTKKPPRSFEYKFKISDNEWFNTVNVKILWKAAYEQQKDKPKIDFEQRILLRLRHDFPPKFEFPIYFSNDRSQAEMWRLEHASDINQQFEVYFRGWQIANFYRDTTNPQHPLTKRAAKIFFGGAVKLAEQPDYFVMMSDDAEQMITEAVPGAKEYPDRANLTRSVYWEDARRIDQLVAQGKCDVARILLEALRNRKDAEASRFAARYPQNPTVLDEKAKIIEARCARS